MGSIFAWRRQFLSRSMVMLSALAFIAGASVAPAYGQTAQAGPIKISIDTPSEGQSVKIGETIGFGGWTVVTDAQGVVETIEVFVDGQPGEGGVSLGKATYGNARPDVAASLGNAVFTNVGFDLPWQVSGATGNRTVYVYVYSSAHGWSYQAVTLMVEPATAATGTSSGNTRSSTQGSQSQSPFARTTGSGYPGQGTQFNPGGNAALGQPYGAYGQSAGYYGQGSQFYSGANPQSYGAGTGTSQYGGPYHAAALRSLGSASPGSPYATSGQSGYGATSPFALGQGYGTQNPYAPSPLYGSQGYGARAPYGSGYPQYPGYYGYR